MKLRPRDFLHYFRANQSYSQHGEDMVLKSYFERTRSGFYVDIGAHHPFRFSNTYYFYRNGWKGINVDPNPGTKSLFDFFRSRDVNLELGIAGEEGALTYYMFDEPALNSFSKELSEQRINETPYKIIGTKNIPVKRLDQVLESQLSPNAEIDFLNVDVEGLDLNVLESNDWNRFRPKFIIVEDLEFEIESPSKSELYNFLTNFDYHIIGRTLTSLIFQSNR